MHRLPALALLAAGLLACGTRPPRTPAVRPEAVAAPPAAQPPRPAILLARARTLRAEGDLGGARSRLELALEVAPDDADVRVELADLLVADGRERERAAALLGGVGERDARWYLVAARLAELGGDAVAAEVAYERALAAAPDPEVRLRRALVLERLGRYLEATAELERVRLERPDDPLVRSRLADGYEAAGALAEAEAELTALAESQPDRAAGWERLARFYERTGRAPEARAALDRARELGGGGRALRPLGPSYR